MRNRGGWSKRAQGLLAQIRDVIDGLNEYWPLTLRQIYYQLVAALLIRNCRSSYGALSRTLAKARIDDLIPWQAMEDRSRSLLTSGGWADQGAFIQDETSDFLAGYRRDLLQGQEYRPEVWVEKDALSRVCHRAAMPYCVPVIVARGFSSVSFLNEARNRILTNRDNGQKTSILYLGDLDPSGWAMLPAMEETLVNEMDCGGLVIFTRCGLLPEQVKTYNLPTNPDALKKKDTRAKKYKEQFGNLAVELDALRPDILAGLVEESIRGVLGLSQFVREQARELQDNDRLEALRARVLDFIGKGDDQ